MKFQAKIMIMPLQELLDPQGKAVEAGLQKNLNMPELEHVRIGKFITMNVQATDEASAAQFVERACKELLANAVMESYKYKLSKLS